MNPILISSTPCKINRKPSFRRFAILACAASVITAFSSTSCATTKGVGQDVKKVGNKIEEAAQ